MSRRHDPSVSRGNTVGSVLATVRAEINRCVFPRGNTLTAAVRGLQSLYALAPAAARRPARCFRRSIRHGAVSPRPVVCST